jgi:DNA-binding NarL/FixJ family response regulator
MTPLTKRTLGVFVVDDSAALRVRLIEMLSQVEGVMVVGQAQDVSEAIAGIGALQPDVVILDIQMPGGSGIDVLRSLKQNHPAMIAIMLTNHPYPQYQRRCAELGADFFLSKSTDSKVLIEISERLVAGGTPIHG